MSMTTTGIAGHEAVAARAGRRAPRGHHVGGATGPGAPQRRRRQRLRGAAGHDAGLPGLRPLPPARRPSPVGRAGGSASHLSARRRPGACVETRRTASASRRGPTRWPAPAARRASGSPARNASGFEYRVVNTADRPAAPGRLGHHDDGARWAAPGCRSSQPSLRPGWLPGPAQHRAVVRTAGPTTRASSSATAPSRSVPASSRGTRASGRSRSAPACGVAGWLTGATGVLLVKRAGHDEDRVLRRHGCLGTGLLARPSSPSWRPSGR